jgi:hypothetical protein
MDVPQGDILFGRTQDEVVGSFTKFFVNWLTDHLSSLPVPRDVHLSISASGDYDYPCKAGGKVGIVAECFRKLCVTKIGTFGFGPIYDVFGRLLFTVTEANRDLEWSQIAFRRITMPPLIFELSGSVQLNDVMTIGFDNYFVYNSLVAICIGGLLRKHIIRSESVKVLNLDVRDPDRLTLFCGVAFQTEPRSFSVTTPYSEPPDEQPLNLYRPKGGFRTARGRKRVTKTPNMLANPPPILRELVSLMHISQGLEAVRSRVVVIPEPGYKARVVTVEIFETVLIGHLMRSLMFSALTSLPESTASDHASLWHFVQRNGIVPDGFVVLSSDLTNATDTYALLPYLRDALKAFSVWFKRIGFGWLAEFLFLCIDGRDLNYTGFNHETGGDDFVRQTSGILMGYPTTYVLLTLVNICALFYSAFIHDCKRFASKVQGDDLIAVVPLEVAKTYGTIISCLGMRLSVGAHFISRDFAVFCEEGALIKRPLSRRLRHFDTVKVRHFAKSSDLDPRKSVHPVLSFANYLSAQFRYYRIGREVCGLQYAVYREFYNRYRKYPIYLPAFLGGLGIGHPDGERFIWRRRIPSLVKAFISAALSDDVSFESYCRLTMLSGFNLRNRRGIRHIEVSDWIAPLWRYFSGSLETVREAFLSKSPLMCTGDQLAMVLREHRPDLFPGWMLPHIDDGSAFAPVYTGSKWLLSSLRKTGFLPLSDLVSDVGRSLSFTSALIFGIESLSARVTLTHWARNWDRKLSEFAPDAWRYAPGKGRIHFSSFDDLNTRCGRKFGRLWVSPFIEDVELLHNSLASLRAPTLLSEPISEVVRSPD